jgi:hypothetical protein
MSVLMIVCITKMNEISKKLLLDCEILLFPMAFPFDFDFKYHFNHLSGAC